MKEGIGLLNLALKKNEIFVDNFAGGGGVSEGYEQATGRYADVAINHSQKAIAMHKVNHPKTLHYCESVFDVDPVKVCCGRRVGLAWFSPDCTHFSVAKGGEPVNQEIRGLAWVEIKWAISVSPRVMILENVKEFQTWGPLDEQSHPIKERQGETFNAFMAALTTGLDPDHPAWPEIEKALGSYFDKDRLVEGLGYTLEFRVLLACDYGAPTSRLRFFMIARCDGQPIVWPEVTHGDPQSKEVKTGKLKPWRSAAEILDFNLPCPSIFDSAVEIKKKYGLRAKRPLVEKTMKRIAQGLDKFFIHNPEPYLIQVNHRGDVFRGQSINEPLPTITAKHGHGISAPVLLQYHDSREARGQVLNRPLMTIDTSPRYALVAASMIKYYGQGVGQRVDEPLHTITSKDRNGLSAVHLVRFKGKSKGQSPDMPLQTVTTCAGQFGFAKTSLRKIDGCQDLRYWPEIRTLLNKYCNYNIADDEIVLFEMFGELYFICDIGLRMLTPRELFRGNDFPDDYIIDVDYYGNFYPRSEQVARCGNAVPPSLPRVLIRGNVPEMCVRQKIGWGPRKEEGQLILF
ncbi:MAG: DNA cytosine methyltransferase [Clostridia bacterium]